MKPRRLRRSFPSFASWSRFCAEALLYSCQQIEITQTRYSRGISRSRLPISGQGTTEQAPDPVAWSTTDSSVPIGAALCLAMSECTGRPVDRAASGARSRRRGWDARGLAVNAFGLVRGATNGGGRLRGTGCKSRRQRRLRSVQSYHSRLRRFVFLTDWRLIAVHTRLAGSTPLGIVRCRLDGRSSGGLDSVRIGI